MIDGPVIVLAAHADDETLGMGASMAKLTRSGVHVHVGVATDSTSAQYPSDGAAYRRRRAAFDAAMSALDVSGSSWLDAPDMRLRGFPTQELQAWVRSLVEREGARSIFVPWRGDINDDHRCLYEAASVVCRPVPSSGVGAFLAYEIPSSTEWGGLFGDRDFRPNFFIDVVDDMASKRAAFNCFADEIRPFPHPRSLESIEALSVLRGAQVGLRRAEAFELIYGRAR